MLQEFLVQVRVPVVVVQCAAFTHNPSAETPIVGRHRSAPCNFCLMSLTALGLTRVPKRLGDIFHTAH